MEHRSDVRASFADDDSSERRAVFSRGVVAVVGAVLLAGISGAALAAGDEGSQAWHAAGERPEDGGRALSVPLTASTDPADPRQPSSGTQVLMWSMVVAPSVIMLVTWAAQRFIPKASVWTYLSISSYALLVPGLACKIFDYRITGMSGMMEIKNVHETIFGFAVNLLIEGGMGLFGAAMVVLYAVVIPLVKLGLLIAAERWRNGSPEQVRSARKFVIVLKSISKWASPDIFAYVILIYLVRSLTHEISMGPGFNMEAMRGVGFLRLGFTGFATFCVFSTIATFGLRTPQEPQDAREVATGDKASPTCLRGKSLVALVCALFAVFSVMLCVGIQLPCMALRINMDSMYEPDGPIPLSMKSMVESFHLAEIAKADVSMWACITDVALRVAHGGGPNDVIALVLYVVFVLAFTVLDMFVLVIAAFQQHWDQSKDSEQHFSALSWSHVLKKLSMMDVALTGIALVLCCGSVYKKEGLALYFRWGLFVLFCAEACHYLTYFLVCRAAPQRDQQVRAKQAGEVEDNSMEADDSVSISEPAV